MKVPAGKTVTLTFVSHPVKDVKARWWAYLSFPAEAAEGDELPVKVVDGEMAPVAEGVFECFGAKIAISEGFGALAYADFIKGKHEKGIWLHRKGGEPVPGGLTFA